uniref:Uncharacterized protein n=1 Tax=Tolypothrix bouteillei VB521301 TaxID=1479485 RepID=A0A0C1N3W6_9CYAN
MEGEEFYQKKSRGREACARKTANFFYFIVLLLPLTKYSDCAIASHLIGHQVLGQVKVDEKLNEITAMFMVSSFSRIIHLCYGERN